MISDSITNASATAAPSARDLGKKKRSNRSAKLKQSKLGLRREQWLSQVAMSNKGCKEGIDSNRRSGNEKPAPRDNSVENLDGRRREEDNNGTLRHESFIESLSNSPNSILGGMNSNHNYSGSSSRSSSSSSGSGGFCSGNITEEEDADDDDCLDDWEAIADALEADEKHEKENNTPEVESIRQSVSPRDSINGSTSLDKSEVAPRVAKPDCVRTTSRKQKSNQAWRPDDKLRPQGLPNLTKQCSCPAMDLHYSSVAVPSSCPICYEDLDLTDSNFLPCPCGFRLCLFCHKTICDGDGRCPGCRKPYERNSVKVEACVQGGGLTIRLARSSSMFCRS